MAVKKTTKAAAAPKKAVEVVIRPVKETLTKSALINLLAEQNEITRKQAVGVWSTLERVLFIQRVLANSPCLVCLKLLCAKFLPVRLVHWCATQRQAKWWQHRQRQHLCA
jgi:hypothetical protein